MCAILIPLFGLQASNTFWQPHERWILSGGGAYLGSLLLSISLLMASGISILTPIILRRFGYSLVIGINYAMVCVFVCSHLYPSVYILLPAYIIWGLSHSPAWISKTALLVHYGSKLSCSHYDCPIMTSSQQQKQSINETPIDEHRLFCNRDQQIRRLVRWFHLAKDLGIIIGALITSLLLSTKSTIPAKDINYFQIDSATSNSTTISDTLNVSSTSSVDSSFSPLSLSTSSSPSSPTAVSSNYFLSSGSWWYSIERSALIWSSSTQNLHQSPSLLTNDKDARDYRLDEHGVRICGADMCPIWINFRLDDSGNNSNNNSKQQFYQITSQPGKPSISFFKVNHTLLILIYLIFALSSLLMTIASGKIHANFRRSQHVKHLHHNLLYIGPLAFFVGTEQAYILSDFLRVSH